MIWRTGKKLGRTLYRDEVCVGMVDTPELAREIVEAVYAVEEGRNFWDHVDSGHPAVEREKQTAAKLAAATALLDRASNENHRHYPDDHVSIETWNEIDDFLANRTAAVPQCEVCGASRGQVEAQHTAFEYVGSSSSPLPPAFEAANEALQPAEPTRPHCSEHAGWRSDCERCAAGESSWTHAYQPAAPSHCPVCGLGRPPVGSCYQLGHLARPVVKP